ncbi:hypothetical protein BXZ70DRAFT_900271 [Cristinia sonorae]|uniref:DUF6570 domain-containing protein n=1 Tax=Cristinia sonorae TaxID=1940300 RepID=A0A8K0XKX6_9AGAR|nr:hypothetical protein BXZ70DRAFT_900271 [Cristinia sonorae]
MITRKERKCSDDPVEHISGPVLAPGCKYVCMDCFKDLKLKRYPKKSLVNGLWLGEVPFELQGLSWTEKLLISRVNHNYCVVRFSMSGMTGLHKMKANAISFSVPMPKVYKTLPPSKDQLDNVLAFIYIGSVKPSTEDWHRTPFLVRHNKVKAALDWLKLNHKDYADLEISEANLKEYSEDEPPVVPIGTNQTYSRTKRLLPSLHTERKKGEVKLASVRLSFMELPDRNCQSWKKPILKR